MPKEKRAQTGYQLYMHENYAAIKQQQQMQQDNDNSSTTLSSKDILSIIARQWSEASEQEKQAWQFRAESVKQTQTAGERAATAAAAHVADTAAAALPPEVEDMDLPPEAATLEDWLQHADPGHNTGGGAGAGAAAAAAAGANRKRAARKTAPSGGKQPPSTTFSV